MNVPFTYDELNLIEGAYMPSTVKLNSKAFQFWQRALFQRALSVITFDGLPDEWKKVENKFYAWLFGCGFLAVTETPEHGMFFNNCSLYGFNLYYEPTKALINNPALSNSLELEIGSECAIVKMSPDYRGVLDICRYYAEKLALLDSAQNTSLINSKVPFLLGAKNKAAAEALKKLLDLTNSGEPCVVYDKTIADNIKDSGSPFHQVKLFEGTDYITDKLLRETATVLNQFDTEIGIQTLPYQKAERFVAAEAESKKQESIARCTTWLRSIRASLEDVNKLYGLNITARLTFEDTTPDIMEVTDNG